MAHNKAKTEFRTLLQKRTLRFRKDAGYTRKQMGMMLGVKEDTYKKWEIGSSGAMPVMYVDKFCTIVKRPHRDFIGPLLTEEEKQLSTV